MKRIQPQFSILIALIIGLLLIGSASGATEETILPNVTLEVTPDFTLEMTPDISLDSIPEITPEITLEGTPEDTPVLHSTEFLSADELPALDAEGDPLVANYSQNRTYGPAPLAIQFYDRSSGTVTNRSWDFGDGESSELKNPVHMFASAGTYTVRLTVSDGTGSDTYEVADRIRVDTPEAPGAALSANKTSWSAPAVVQFYDRSTGYPTTWAWDFGDGATANVKNPVHTYAATGNYTVTLTVTNDLGTDTVTKTEYFHAYDPAAPAATLSANKTSWSSPAAVQFYDRSTGFPTSWQWDFGDGATATVKNPVHRYAATGNYTITLTVSNDLGTNSITQTDYFHAYDPVAPTAALSANKTSWSSPAAVQFYDRSTGFPTSWQWDFGDGATATVKNPVHTYGATGNYTITLTVNNDLGTDTVTKTEYFHAYDPVAPTAALSANKTSWSSPAVVQFYDRSAGFPTSWQWDFGDGTTANVKNPVHTYEATGNYTVTLTVSNDLGTDSITQAEYFHAYDPIAPTAALSANKTSWSSPAVVQFYDRSAGFPTSWQWDFGDGATATVKNPVHTYEATGNYTVTLVVTNDLGTDTVTKTEYFHAYDPAAPTAALSANKTSWSAPAAIQFYDRSAGFPTSWQWDFGDGTTATVKNPVHTYEATGNYTITLTATNELGSDTKTATDYIIVSGSSAPVAAISANKTSWSAPAVIQFYDRSTGFPTAWSWDFGDGTTANVKNPVHTYTATGNYTVNLTITNEIGSDTKTVVDYIRVSDSAAPAAAISANKTSWSTPAVIQFYDRSTGFPTAWAWDFGDGTTATVKNPVHTYTATGNYTVNLTITNEVGSDTKVMPDYIKVSVPEIPTAKISANRTAGPAPMVIQFYDRSTGFPTEWLWDFGDGTNSTVKNPVHSYAYGGNYTITLRAANALGNTSVTALNYIKASGSGPVVPVVADFTANATSGPVPLAIAFTDISTGSPTSWNWSFGDGTFAEVQNPVHTYAAAGNYSISLAASNVGSSDSRTVPDYIIVQSSGPAFDARVELTSMPPTMFQGEHYLADVKVNNTGSRTWSGDPASPDYVYLEGIGGTTGDAAKFNLTHIPMIFENETVAPGESYDFLFFTEAMGVGNFSPSYQLKSAQGEFGPVSTMSVEVIENPFHPVVQPNGSKLYATTIGNLSSGMSVTVYGPKVYIDKAEAYQFEDPRFLINPSLKSGIFDLDLNDSFTYADVTIKYDPAKVPSLANLSMSYFNETAGNYTVVPSTIDTVNHTVTARVTHFSKYTILDPIQYFNLAVPFQNAMGYLDVDGSENWTANPPLESLTGASFNNGVRMPPGNYTIYTSGSYSNNYLDFAGTCYGGWATADTNFDTWSGMHIAYNNPYGLSDRQVTTVRYTTGILKIVHGGGPIRMYNRPVTGRACGAVSYKMVYTDGPLFGDPNMDYYRKLNNDAYALANPLDQMERYRAAAGCVLGQAGKKGNFVEQNLGSIPGYDFFLGEDTTESAAYFIGHVACSIPFVEVTSVRDVAACLYVGDDLGALLNSLGGLGKFKNVLTESGVLASFMEKNVGKTEIAKDIFTNLERNGLTNRFTDNELYYFMKETLSPGEIGFVDKMLGEGKISVPRFIQYINSDKGLIEGWVRAEAGRFNALPGNSHGFSPKVDTLIIGKYIKDSKYSYEKIGDAKKANFFMFSSDPGWETNEQILDLAIFGKNKIHCTTDPDLATGNFLNEIDYLKANGYIKGSHWTETIGETTYDFWSMVKV
ncbi:MAG: PKD domain-containing protein [Methanoregula sp.]